MSETIKDDTYRIQKIQFYCEAIIDFTTETSYEELRKDNH